MNLSSYVQKDTWYRLPIKTLLALSQFSTIFGLIVFGKADIFQSFTTHFPNIKAQI